MSKEIFQIALVVKDYDEAISFYVNKLNFDLIEDTQLSESKRWVVVAPKGSSTKLLLAKAANDEQIKCVGNQTGGRVFLFMHTDDISSDYERFKKNGVTIIREPVTEKWGIVLVFADLYGNQWDLIQPVK